MKVFNLNNFRPLVAEDKYSQLGDTATLSVNEEAIKIGGESSKVSLCVNTNKGFTLEDFKLERTDKAMAKNFYVRRQLFEALRNYANEQCVGENPDVKDFLKDAEKTLFGDYKNDTGVSYLSIKTVRNLVSRLDDALTNLPKKSGGLKDDDVGGNENIIKINDDKNANENVIKIIDNKKIDLSEWQLVDIDKKSGKAKISSSKNVNQNIIKIDNDNSVGIVENKDTLQLRDKLVNALFTNLKRGSNLHPVPPVAIDDELREECEQLVDSVLWYARNPNLSSELVDGINLAMTRAAFRIAVLCANKNVYVPIDVRAGVVIHLMSILNELNMTKETQLFGEPGTINKIADGFVREGLFKAEKWAKFSLAPVENWNGMIEWRDNDVGGDIDKDVNNNGGNQNNANKNIIDPNAANKNISNDDNSENANQNNANKNIIDPNAANKNISNDDNSENANKDINGDDNTDKVGNDEKKTEIIPEKQEVKVEEVKSREIQMAAAKDSCNVYIGMLEKQRDSQLDAINKAGFTDEWIINDLKGHYDKVIQEVKDVQENGDESAIKKLFGLTDNEFVNLNGPLSEEKLNAKLFNDTKGMLSRTLCLFAMFSQYDFEANDYTPDERDELANKYALLLDDVFKPTDLDDFATKLARVKKLVSPEDGKTVSVIALYFDLAIKYERGAVIGDLKPDDLCVGGDGEYVIDYASLSDFIGKIKDKFKRYMKEDGEFTMNGDITRECGHYLLSVRDQSLNPMHKVRKYLGELHYLARECEKENNSVEFARGIYKYLYQVGSNYSHPLGGMINEMSENPDVSELKEIEDNNPEYIGVQELGDWLNRKILDPLDEYYQNLFNYGNLDETEKKCVEYQKVEEEKILKTCFENAQKHVRSKQQIGSIGGHTISKKRNKRNKFA